MAGHHVDSAGGWLYGNPSVHKRSVHCQHGAKIRDCGQMLHRSASAALAAAVAAATAAGSLGPVMAATVQLQLQLHGYTLQQRSQRNHAV